MNKTLCLATILILFFLPAFLRADNPPQSESLPIELTPDELLRLDQIGINHVWTAPPPSGVIHSCAEWEPSEGVIIRYPFGLSLAVIKEMAEDLIVYTIIASTSQQSTVTSQYTSAGVNMAHVQFIIAPTNSFWTRDYGPWFVFDGNDNYGIVDPIYNRPRPQDDAIPSAIGTLWGVPVYGMSLTTAGGNYMSDGLGRAISTTLIYEENPGLTHAQVDSIILAYMGNDYVVVQDALGEYIEHIDCWGKLLSPTTILVLALPTSNPQHDDLDAAASYFASLTSAWGKPYTVARVYSPNGQPYTNSTILNRKVFVPISGSSWDDSALAVYQTYMPGYEVLGFTGDWVSTDALHCRTMGVPDRKMLFVYHVPLDTTSDTLNNYLVSVEIVPRSDQGLIPDSLKIYYKINSGAYQYSMLSPTVNPKIYQGYIPAQPYGTDISYYIKTADSSGRVATQPYIGEPGAHKFSVLNLVPVIALSQTSFGFESHVGAKAILKDTLTITNGGLGTLNWQATKGQPWLTLTPGSGIAPGNVELKVTTTGLTAGMYNDIITVSAAGAANSPQYVEVTLNILPAIPAVISTIPVGNAAGVLIESDVSVTFSIPMDAATINSASFMATGSLSGSHSGTISYDPLTRTALMQITIDFAKGEQVQVQLTTDILSEEGTPLADNYAWNFQTEVNHQPYTPANPSPQNNAFNVPINVNLTWSGGDPDGDDVKYKLYFGDENPPPALDSNLTATQYTLTNLSNGTEYFWYLIARDNYSGNATSSVFHFITINNYVCGDATGDGVANVSDAVQIIAYVFTGNNPPDPYASGDANCDGMVNVSDAVYLINYVFISGSPYPCDPDKDGIPDC